MVTALIVNHIMLKARIGFLLLAVLILACSGEDKRGPVATATLGVDSTAWDIVSKALLAYSHAESGHVESSVTLEGSGSKLSIDQDLLFDENTTYLESSILGAETRVLQTQGAACVKEPGGDWRRERSLDSQDSPRTGGGILADLNNLSYELLERLPDSQTEDGHEAFVIQGTMDEGTLALMRDSLNQQGLVGPAARVEAMTMTVAIEKDSLRVRTIHFDTEFSVDEGSFNMIMDMKIDAVDEPISLPEDIPETCPGSTI